jgi:hypothetical protein
MRGIKKDSLIPLVNFSIYDNLGSDSWNIYSIANNHEIGVIYFSQNVRGWESEEWFYLELTKKNTALLVQIQELKDPLKQVEIINQIEKTKFTFEH